MKRKSPGSSPPDPGLPDRCLTPRTRTEQVTPITSILLRFLRRRLPGLRPICLKSGVGLQSEMPRRRRCGEPTANYFAPALVGVVLFLGLVGNAIETKRNMCHDTGRLFEAAQLASMLRK
jgi:hypothetical protein